jgi:hypothetical protein
LWHLYLQRLLQHIRYIVIQFIPPPPSFSPLPLIPAVISTGIIFAFTYVCTLYSSFYLLSPPSPHHTGDPLKNLLHLPLLWFLEEKR